MTDAETFNFARQTLHELDESCITAADLQCVLPLTIPRLEALSEILTFYIVHHSLNLPNGEEP